MQELAMLRAERDAMKRQEEEIKRKAEEEVRVRARALKPWHSVLQSCLSPQYCVSLRVYTPK
jgi:hypothetical protein